MMKPSSVKDPPSHEASEAEMRPSPWHGAHTLNTVTTTLQQNLDASSSLRDDLKAQ